MQISDLIPIGKLGNSIDKNGFISFKKNRNFQPFYLDLKDLFLVFTDHRVRYVTIDKVLEGNKLKIRFDETEVTKEAAKAGKVQVMLSNTDVEEVIAQLDSESDIDKFVIFKNHKIGKVVDIFETLAHEIHIVKLSDGKEIMIPDVEFYISKKDKQNVFVKNIEGLLEL